MGLRLDIYNWPPGLYFWGQEKMGFQTRHLKPNLLFHKTEGRVGSTLVFEPALLLLLNDVITSNRVAGVRGAEP